MKKRGNLLTFIVVVATLAAAAAIIVARIDKICDFLGTYKKPGAGSCRCGCCEDAEYTSEDESDFEDVEL